MKNRRVEIFDDNDVAQASSEALRLGLQVGFSRSNSYMLATAVSELATNIYRYAKEGEMSIRVVEKDTRKGIEITAQDQGPGITNLEAAMLDHVSSTNSLGIGLPGAKRLMDEFEIATKPGLGTKIVARKWI